MIRLIDRSYESPEDSLALDEALLQALQAVVESGERQADGHGRSTAHSGSPAHDGSPAAATATATPYTIAARSAPIVEALRFWECPRPVVVLGRSGRLEEEVDVEACRRAGVPVLRRVSGGGTVMLGPGCLNFTLALSLADRPELRDVQRSMAAIVSTIATALPLDGLHLEGTSDLCWHEWKVSGHAQRRTRDALLHHGTLLYDLDLDLMSTLLRDPHRQPVYRAHRPHRDFVRNLPLTADAMRQSLAHAFGAVRDDDAPLPSLTLVKEPYEDLLRKVGPRRVMPGR